MDIHKAEKLLQEKVKEVRKVKVFHVYKRRNEWINWDGDTSLVNRSGKAIKLSDQEARDYAECRRLQGTRFFIDELPALQVLSRSGSMLITEVFTDTPLLWALDHPSVFNGARTVGELRRCFTDRKWLVKHLFDRTAVFSPFTDTFYKRESSPGRSGSSMAWSLRPLNPDLKRFNALVAEINRRKKSSKVDEDDADQRGDFR